MHSNPSNSATCAVNLTPCSTRRPEIRRILGGYCNQSVEKLFFQQTERPINSLIGRCDYRVLSRRSGTVLMYVRIEGRSGF